jgi:hypothetical protein
VDLQNLQLKIIKIPKNSKENEKFVILNSLILLDRKIICSKNI